MTDEKAITVQTNVSLGAAVLPSPAHVVSYATDVSKELSTIINRQKLYSVINGRKYVQVEGWTTMGAMLGVVPRTVSVEEIHDGVFEATVELVRVSDGAIIGRGIAECGADDETDKYGKPVWANRARYARKSMAITRATGKAFRLSFSWIMKLAGYEATPWEEMLGVVEGEAEEVRPPAPRTSNASSRRPASTVTQAQPIEGEVVEEPEPKASPKQPPQTVPPPWSERKRTKADEALELPDGEKRMCDLDGRELGMMDHNGPKVVGVHSKHWKNRMANYWPDARGDYRKVGTITVAEFMDMMREPSTEQGEEDEPLFPDAT